MSSTTLCQKQDWELSNYYQQFIYLMNEDKMRTAVMKKHVTDTASFQWLGTWYIILHDDHGQPLSRAGETLLRMVAAKKAALRKKPYSLFTVCVSYEGNRVHYVAFVYDAAARALLSFDPGVELYLHGMKTIIPRVREAFRDNALIDSAVINQRTTTIGRCHDYIFKKKKYGVQYNGRTNFLLPADAFCQTWTLRFLCRYMTDRDTDFVKTWCAIAPHRRESDVVHGFVVPILEGIKPVAREYQRMTDEEAVARMREFSASCLRVRRPASQAP
jgi:hypothetical protein